MKQNFFSNDLWELKPISAEHNIGCSAIEKSDVEFKKTATVKDLVETMINLPRSEKDSEWGGVYLNNQRIMKYGNTADINDEIYQTIKDSEIKKCTCFREWCNYDFKIEL